MKNFFLYDPKLLLYGFLIIFFASYGQTFFISLFNTEIRIFYGLSDGEFGLVYAVATLLSSFLLISFAKLITKKPISPTKIEIDNNYRSRSAKMRVIKKIKDN